MGEIWPSPYIVDLSLYIFVGHLSVMVDFSLYCWRFPYTVSLVQRGYGILYAFSLYCWPSPYTGILLASSYILLVFCSWAWPALRVLASANTRRAGHAQLGLLLASSLYTVGLLHILLAFSIYSWPSPYTAGLLPIQFAFSLYCWP